MSLSHLAKAFSAEGIDPAAKLVLILASNGCDQDGRYFEPYSDLVFKANLDVAGFESAVGRLLSAGMACFSLEEDPETGERRPCVLVLFGED